jgi:hypothetical protein
MSLTFANRADFENARRTGHTCAPPYIATCRACELYEQWAEDEGAALEAAYEQWQEEHDAGLFPCAGLWDCDERVEVLGSLCPFCRAIADDCVNDARLELS